MDAPPKDASGNSECRGVAVFHIADGRLDDVDLSGVDFAFYNYFPSNISSGDWKVGVVVDTSASDEQVGALGRILSGQEGGMFGELAGLIGENLGTERGKVALSNGERVALSVEGHSDAEFELARGMDGRPTTVRNAMFGFAPEFQVGRTTGHSSAFGLSFEPSYGESADFTFSSEGEAAVSGRM